MLQLKYFVKEPVTKYKTIPPRYKIMCRTTLLKRPEVVYLVEFCDIASFVQEKFG